MLSRVYVATPVLPVGRRCPRPAGRAGLGQRIEQIGGAVGHWDRKKTWLKVKAKIGKVQNVKSLNKRLVLYRPCRTFDRDTKGGYQQTV